jgi:hypothetical protein
MTKEVTKMRLMSFSNKEYGITSHITLISKGFSVTLFDDDAQLFVGIAAIYPDIERAIKKAKEIVNLETA